MYHSRQYWKSRKSKQSGKPRKSWNSMKSKKSKKNKLQSYLSIGFEVWVWLHTTDFVDFLRFPRFQRLPEVEVEVEELPHHAATPEFGVFATGRDVAWAGVSTMPQALPLRGAASILIMGFTGFPGLPRFSWFCEFVFNFDAFVSGFSGHHSKIKITCLKSW